MTAKKIYEVTHRWPMGDARFYSDPLAVCTITSATPWSARELVGKIFPGRVVMYVKRFGKLSQKHGGKKI